MILIFAAPETAVAQPAPGTPDLGFGVDGVTTWPSSVASAGATDVAVDAFGRIVVVGYRAESFVDEDFAILRYLPNGQLDASFGGGGAVTTPIGPSNNRAMAMAIAPDGKILVAGTAYNPVGPPPQLAVFALARYLPDGSVDTGFGATRLGAYRSRVITATRPT